MVFEIIKKSSFIPNCTKTIMGLLINNILKKYEIAYHNYAEAKRASSAKIIYSNLYIRSKQPRTIKTVIHNDILTSIRRKKVQSPAKQFKELFSLCPNHFRWNGVVVCEV